MGECNNNKMFVGLGSFHGDDQLGWLIAERLQDQEHIRVRTAAVPADLLHWLENLDVLYLCDACQGPDPSGTIHRWKWSNAKSDFPDIVKLRSSNSHQLSLPEVLSLAANLNLLPDTVVLWAVDAKEFDAGHPLSDTLMKQLPDIVKRIAGELNHA